MDSRERGSDLQTSLRAVTTEFRKTIWTALPGIVQSFNAQALTVVVQPAIQGTAFEPVADGSGDLTQQYVNLPLLLDVPVVFPRGGNCTLTFPITAGDECLVVASARSIDVWWQLGGVQPPFENRTLDLADGFALVGPFSQASVIKNVSTRTAQLRSEDGSTYVELNAAGQIVNIVAPGGVNITAPTVAISGAMTVSKTIAAQQSISSQVDVTTGTISLKNHKHGGVASGGSITAVPQ